jgi:hypothetical protein
MELIAGMRRRRRARYVAAERDRKVRPVDTSSWHYRVYAWWFFQKNRYRPAGRANFCAYWRAVIFWAAGRAVRKFFPPAIVLTVAIGLVATLVWGLIWHRTGTLQTLVGIGGTIYAIGIVIVVITVFRWFLDDGLDVGDFDSRGTWPEWVKALLLILCGLPSVPVTIGLSVVLAALFLVVLVLYLLFEELEVHKLLGRALWWLVRMTGRALNAHFRSLPWLRPWVLLPLVSLGIIVHEGLQVGLNWAFLVAAGLVGIFLGFTVAATVLYLTHKYEQRVQRREYETVRRLFAMPGFMAWYKSAKEDGDFRWTPAIADDETPESLAHSLAYASAIEIVKAYLAAHPPDASQVRTLPRELRPERPRKRRMRTPKFVMWVWRFLVGLGEFIALLWSGLVYYKRVKACPYLEFTSAPQTPATDMTN